MFDLNVCYTWFVSRLFFSSFHSSFHEIVLFLRARVCVCVFFFAPVKWINYAHIEISVRIADLTDYLPFKNIFYTYYIYRYGRRKKVSTMLYRDFVWFVWYVLFISCSLFTPAWLLVLLLRVRLPRTTNIKRIKRERRRRRRQQSQRSDNRFKMKHYYRHLHRHHHGMDQIYVI